MNKIKVVSNPYEKTVTFSRYDLSSESWITINSENNSNSKLVSAVFQRGFFPFKVYDILKEIENEYAVPDEKLELIFEGPNDEKQQLDEALKDERFSNIILSSSTNYLENARDVLPEINRIFRNLEPLIIKNIGESNKEIEAQLKRFSDASGDTVPICVLGTYSAGKSTFINALIGQELLPSAETPVTAKIYKITASTYEDRAKISFIFKDDRVVLTFHDDQVFYDGLNETDAFGKEINEILNDSFDSIISKLHAVLEVINDFADEGVGDLIEILVPFSKGILGDVGSKITIFDTPGSNSSTNSQHSEVLANAMAGMSNGLPVFVTDSSSLDSKDNSNLKEKLISVDGLDERFTMIVVNKAEAADLSLANFKRDSFRNKIMNQVVPRELYAQGIYYVSSILGLGSKLKGHLEGGFYSEQFDTYREKYSNPETKYYKKLYEFDILPRQMSNTVRATAEKSSDLIYANSGLLTIEDSIKTFVDRYSHYDKCQQAKALLDKLLLKTNAVIAEKNEDLHSREAELEANLDDQKSVIVERLKSTSLSQKNDLLIKYPKEMKIFQERLMKQIEKGDVLNRYNEIHKEILSLNPTLNLTEHQQIDISNLKLGNISNEFSNYLSVTRENKTKKITIENLASAQTVDCFRNQFVEELYLSRVEFERISSSFWANHASEIKSQFEAIISGDLGLEPEKRQKLSHLILSYEEINFGQLNLEKFSKEELSYVFRLGDFTLRSSKVNASGLKRTFNDLFKSKMTEFAGSICSEHEKAFKMWLFNLTSIIVQNIIEFSPELSALNAKIQRTKNEVASLEEQQQQIENYTNQIKRMITWK
ncbi:MULTISPECIES: dynamin family protein [Streptococcus]|uniref:dynamin family protein n=1 Tax=Streptococcus TaxID=1301 RepID=UPI000769E427|nr:MULTISPECIES: dynamin family protein [Streptococcus]MTQ48294.1 dynamin [Streptococcus salivarius]